MSLLALDGVSKEFHDITAVDRVSFDVDRGEVVGGGYACVAATLATAATATAANAAGTHTRSNAGVPAAHASQEAMSPIPPTPTKPHPDTPVKVEADSMVSRM